MYDNRYLVFKDILYKYKRHINEKSFLKLLEDERCNNLRETIDYLLDKYNYNINSILLSNDYKKMLYLFSKTRFYKFPPLDFFKKITLNLSRKFKLKVFELFTDCCLFRNSIVILNIIKLFGLFENDRQVQKRIYTITNIFYCQPIYCQREEVKRNKNIIKLNHCLYILDENVIEYIPNELKPYFFENITPQYYKFLKKMKGNFGRKINDFLNPFTLSGGKKEIKSGNKKNTNYYCYLKKKKINYSPYKKNLDNYYEINSSLSIEERKKLFSLFKESELTYGPSDIQSMFSNNVGNYNSKFYNFFVSHQADIINNVNCFSKFQYVARKYREVIKYYASRGNSDPDYITIIEWLRSTPYNVSFGDEKIAAEAQSAGVIKEGYNYYIKLYQDVKRRFKRALPNHDETYICEKNNKKYLINTKILKGTDPLNMLIGESKYTDCCQKHDDIGRQCLEHASKSLMGGIFVVSLIEKETVKPLTQSWIWINEQELVLDNIEQTTWLKSTPNKQRIIYEELIADAIGKASKDILRKSNAHLKNYIINKSKEYMKINNNHKREVLLKRLNDIKIRQSIKVISVGANYSDIIVKDFFKTKAQRPLYLPKDYPQNGYSDANERYIAAGNENNIKVNVSDDYIEEPIYRDKREIIIKKLKDLDNEELKRVQELYLPMHNKEKLIRNIKNFIVHYKLCLSDYIVLAADWYIIYSNKNKIKYTIVGPPRIKDELPIQAKEIERLKKKILQEKL